MERLNAKLHAETSERRDGDMIWRVPRRGGRTGSTGDVCLSASGGGGLVSAKEASRPPGRRSRGAFINARHLARDR